MMEQTRKAAIIMSENLLCPVSHFKLSFLQLLAWAADVETAVGSSICPAAISAMAFVSQSKPSYSPNAHIQHNLQINGPRRKPSPVGAEVASMCHLRSATLSSPSFSFTSDMLIAFGRSIAVLAL